MKNKRNSILMLLVAIMVAAGAVVLYQRSSANSEPVALNEERDEKVADPVALVDNKPISGVEFDRYMKRVEKRFASIGKELSPDMKAKMQKSVLDKLIENVLIDKHAREMGITLDPQKEKEEFAKYKERVGSEEKFAHFLKLGGVTEIEFKEMLHIGTLRRKLIAKVVLLYKPTEDELKKEYQAEKASFDTPEQVSARHILFKTTPAMKKEEVEKQEKEAQRVLNLARVKDASFGDLAVKYSQGPTARRRGKLGTFSRGQMVPEFEKAVFAAKEGEILGPVKTKFGYHVIKVEKKSKARTKSYMEVRKRIMSNLQSVSKRKRTRELFENYRKEAKVIILDKTLANIKIDEPSKSG